jgi:hypothetical protein
VRIAAGSAELCLLLRAIYFTERSLQFQSRRVKFLANTKSKGAILTLLPDIAPNYRM